MKYRIQMQSLTTAMPGWVTLAAATFQSDAHCIMQAFALRSQMATGSTRQRIQEQVGPHAWQTVGQTEVAAQKW